MKAPFFLRHRIRRFSACPRMIVSGVNRSWARAASISRRPWFRPPLGFQGRAKGMAHFLKASPRAYSSRVPPTAPKVKSRSLRSTRAAPSIRASIAGEIRLSRRRPEPVGEEGDGDKGSGHRQDEYDRRQRGIVGLKKGDLIAEHEHTRQPAPAVAQGNTPVDQSFPGFRRVQLSDPLFWIRFFRRGKGPVPLSPLQGGEPGRRFLRSGFSSSKRGRVSGSRVFPPILPRSGGWPAPVFRNSWRAGRREEASGRGGARSARTPRRSTE